MKQYLQRIQDKIDQHPGEEVIISKKVKTCRWGWCLLFWGIACVIVGIVCPSVISSEDVSDAEVDSSLRHAN
jgi:hypothetical protein